jgi:hypothetical protein
MSIAVRRNLIFAWLAVLSGAVGFTAWGEAAQERKVTDFDEINVHRINIVEPDGKPRVIISSRARMAGLFWAGKEYQHPNRDDGGFLFFNDNGDEVGGMTFGNRRQDDHYGASSSLLFDQYQQDQTIGLQYSEQDGKRQAGLRVWDRPDKSLFPAIELSDKLARAKTDAERDQVRAQLKQLENDYRGGYAERFYAGKQLGDAIVKLADKQSRPRLLLKVTPEGAASIEFLDETGKVVRRIPEK